jgi:predicted nucleic acid-binding protein
MAASPNRPQLIAVDANVLFDLANDLEDVIDAVSAIRERLRTARFLIPPTVQHELANWALRGDGQKREAARKAIHLGHLWTFVPANLIAVRHGIAERIAERIRVKGLIAVEEVNDSLVLAETALLGCSMLLTSDEHLRGIDFECLTLDLRALDVVAPVIATPREIVRKFFQR